MIDHDRLAELASQAPLVHAREVHGVKGTTMVHRLVVMVRAIYRVLSPEELTDGLTVIQPMYPSEAPASMAGLTCVDLQAIDELPDHFRTCATVAPLVGRTIRATSELVDPQTVSETAAVYHFHPDVGETIRVGARRFEPYNPTTLPSAYALPTFSTLQAALRRYAVDFARHGTLGGLNLVWRDKKRLMFHEGPERDMRRSLEAFLVAALKESRAVDIRPEPPVDESHPVDIRVIFTHTNRTALIEIKWMGDSADADGGSHVVYRDARAKSGAKQLAEYLDWDRPRSTGHQVVGFLVVFDARRRRITPATESIDATNGLYYREREVDYAQEIVDRQDFAPPMRMFMEPVCE